MTNLDYCAVCGADLRSTGALLIRERATGLLRSICRPSEDHADSDRLPCFRRSVRSVAEDQLEGVWYALEEGDWDLITPEQYALEERRLKNHG